MLCGLFGDDEEDEGARLGLQLVAATRAAAPPPPRAPSQLVGLDNQVGGVALAILLRPQPAGSLQESGKKHLIYSRISSLVFTLVATPTLCSGYPTLPNPRRIPTTTMCCLRTRAVSRSLL